MPRSLRFMYALACVALLAGVTSACDSAHGSKHDAGLSADASDAAPAADTTAADAADTAPGVDPLAPTPAQPGVAPDGSTDLDSPVPAGQARVGKITSADTGFSGVWAHCRTGDFKLYNAKIAVCIESETTNRMEVFSGGKIVDARRLDGPKGEVLDSVFPLVGMGTTHADKVEVVRDGADGGAAVLRVTSHDIPLAHLYGLLGISLGPTLGLHITTEYRLAPDSDTVEIVSFYDNPGDHTRAFFVGDWFGYGDRARLFTPGRGTGAPAGSYGWLASLGKDRSYGWIIPHGEADDVGLARQGIPWAASRAKRIRLDSGDHAAWRRWFVVGDGTLADIREHAARLRGEELTGHRRTVHVHTADGEPVANHSVSVRQADTPVAWGLTDDHGDVQFLLDDDASYELTIGGFAAGADFARTITASADTLPVEVDTPGTLHLQITEAGPGEPLNARVGIYGGAKSWTGVAVGGSLTVELPAGSYQVVVSHGTEFDATTVPVELSAGGSVDKFVQVPRAFDTDGWLSADFHQHMEPSLDSSVSIDDRVLENASVGVEIAVSTDHEVVTDLRPLIAKYHLEHVMTTFPGVEISPVETHIGLYPMTPHHDQRGDGTVPLAVLDDNGEPVKRKIPELVRIARGLPSDPIVQLNHARKSPSGLFALVDYDPTTDPSTIDDPRFTLDFDTMEIINSFSDTCKLFHDWSGLLNSGYYFTGLGNSDTHTLSGESGLPRNFLMLDKTPDQVTEDDIRQVLRAGHVTVGAHAFIELTDGKIPGTTITATKGDSVDFGLQVHTPAWAQADHLVAVANGQVVDTFERGAGADSHLDFDKTVSMVFDQDTWVVFFAYGQVPSGPVHTGKPVVAFTNPIFVDVDGDTDHDGNAFEAPGAGPLSLDAIDAFCQ